jgi:FkbM family methyltransferase
VDIGCSGGIHPIWRQFGQRLRALGIDPNIAEIERLIKAETHDGIEYLAAFAGLAEDHPFAIKKRTAADWSRSPWGRLSAYEAQMILQARAAELTTDERTAANLWRETELADVAKTIVVPDYMREHGISDFDFLKIDIDGKDYDVLNSFDDALEQFDVLGVGIEVCFFGSELDTDNTFHNTDRFLKARGFELFNMSQRHYSTTALPSKFVYHLPAATEVGRLLQGDAVYLRDLASPLYDAMAQRMGAQKLLNLACLFACFGLPDCAAELLVNRRGIVAKAGDVDAMLDLLAAQMQAESEAPLSYKEWVGRFAEQDRMFYREPPA